jgi:hypothetical protein
MINEEIEEIEQDEIDNDSKTIHEIEQSRTKRKISKTDKAQVARHINIKKAINARTAKSLLKKENELLEVQKKLKALEIKNPKPAPVIEQPIPVIEKKEINDGDYFSKLKKHVKKIIDDDEEEDDIKPQKFSNEIHEILKNMNKKIDKLYLFKKTKMQSGSNKQQPVNVHVTNPQMSDDLALHKIEKTHSLQERLRRINANNS